MSILRGAQSNRAYDIVKENYKFNYMSKKDDYRRAAPVSLGKVYEFDIEPDSKEVFFSVALFHPSSRRGLIARVIKKISRGFQKSRPYVLVKVEVGADVFEQKVILSGFSRDYLLYNDLFNDWFDVIVPALPCDSKTVKVSVCFMDDRGQKITAELFPYGVLMTEPVFLKTRAKPNIIYITLESLTDIHYLFEKGWISEGTFQLYKEIFTDFIEIKGLVAQADWTFPAVASYHTGLMTSQHKMFDSEKIKSGESRLNDNIITIAELLKKEGYMTFSANLGKLNPLNGYAKGVDVYYKPASSLGHAEYTGDDKWVIKKLEQFKNNCFVHLHYDRLHHPLYSTTGPWSRIRTKDNPMLNQEDKLLRPEVFYEANLRMVLFEMNNIITYLKLNNRFEETIMIVTGDHGFDIGEWDDMKQEDPLIDSRVKVPYLINRKSSLTSRNASIRPFFEICGLLDIKLPAYFSWLPQTDARLGACAVSEAVLKSREHMYVLNISDDDYKYVLYAAMDWENFTIKAIEDEYVLDLGSGEKVSRPDVRQKFVEIREIYCRKNKEFYENIYMKRTR